MQQDDHIHLHALPDHSFVHGVVVIATPNTFLGFMWLQFWTVLQVNIRFLHS